MKTGLSLRTGLGLTLTPALQQALRLLQLSTLELQAEIRNALESNFMLEQGAEEEDSPLNGNTPATNSIAADTSEAPVDANTSIPDEMPVDADWSDVYDTTWSQASAAGPADNELQDFMQANLHRDRSLREHLEWQARTAPLNDLETDIALALIDAINDDGYLENWDAVCETLCSADNIDTDRVERVLAAVQDFEPVGIAARDIRECLCLQLHAGQASGSADALRLLDAPMESIARHDISALARTTGLHPTAVSAALALISTLQPHPGRPWQDNSGDYVDPDVVVNRQGDRWRVTLNPAHIPRLRINPRYYRLIKRAATQSTTQTTTPATGQAAEQTTLKRHLQEARSLISGLSARNETLLRVTQAIVEAQRAFLDYGAEAMRPLVLRDIAKSLSLHESTVSRATANKYILTPRGLFELKHFFSSHVNTTHGGTCSSTAIQAMIKRLIAQERPVRPLSDAAIAQMLGKEGIQVARRTVAKYREGLHIPPSSERRMRA